MGWQGNSYFDSSGMRVTSWRKLRDADGNGVLVNPKKVVDWIDAFLGRNPYAALSNFHRGRAIVIDGVSYKTAEHAFHAGKATSDADRRRVARAATADDAKQVGRSIAMRTDWDTYRRRWMRKVLAAKFAPGRAEARVLASTGRARIVEGTLWNDEFWGVNLERRGRPGENVLGRMLMSRRAALLRGR